MRLKLDRVSKRFGGQPALDDITVEIQSARSLVLIGPSGSGKSTLLRLIGGLETLDGGTIEMDGERVPVDAAGLLQHRRKIGTVFQAFNLFPHLTALANLTLPLEKAHGMERAKAADIAGALLAKFRLESHAHKKPSELSGGQRQRVAIARALSINPRFMLFDEPTSALDPEMAAEVLDTIEQLRAEGRDLIVVTHQMAFARRIADWVVFMAEGRIVESAPGAALFDCPTDPRTRDFLAKVLKY